MGTDCTVVFECCEDGSTYWSICGILHLPRHYELFDKLQERGTGGYPDNIDYSSQVILEELECWGEHWMTLDLYRKVLQELGIADCPEYMPIRKQVWKNMKVRVIYRFDN